MKKYIDKIRKIAGYRENSILDNLKNYKVIRNDSSYYVIRFTDINGNYFEYEAKSNRITG